MQLHELTIGNKAYIENLTSQNALRERMLALGLTKGTTVEAIRKGPTGDPTIYNIRGAMIALRKEEASLIHIAMNRELISAAALLNNEQVQKENDHEVLEVLDGLNISINPE